jgi:hypothetical protein
VKPEGGTGTALPVAGGHSIGSGGAIRLSPENRHNKESVMSRQNPTPEELELVTRLITKPSPNDRAQLTASLQALNEQLRIWQAVTKTKKRLTLMRDAVNALLTPIPSNSPGEPLVKLATFLDLVSELLPPPYNVWSGFLQQYSKALMSLAGSLNKINANILSRDIKGGTITTFGGNPDLLIFISTLVDVNKTKSASSLPAIPQDVVNWYMENSAQFAFLTGDAPGIQKKYFLGIDRLKKDDVDRNELKVWFYNNKETVKYYRYGNATLPDF